ncbi:MAG: type I methionyl aminopeptidase [Patescibacteria group bacterium]|nr:type I methionyl aminopeptidase [Patescibacteria group bacterium]MDD4610499.1 type I methionyl aminopeptidase [Patescibacteria group bacterium]
MIKIKTKEEIEIIKEGGKILAAILDRVISEIQPGVSTGELEDLACELIEAAGGRPSFKHHKMHEGIVFPTALCTSVNEQIVHAPAKPARVLKSGDIIGIDIGMEYPIKKELQKVKNKYSTLGGYYTDMAKTVAVGNVNAKTKKLLDVTEYSLELAIEQVKPGNTINDIGSAVQNYAESQDFSVVRDLVGHGVGYAVHEDPQIPNYKILNNKNFKNVVLAPGMVIAIEPMVNVGDWRIEVANDEMAILTADCSLSAHFEHTIAVTEDGHEVLTSL